MPTLSHGWRERAKSMKGRGNVILLFVFCFFLMSSTAGQKLESSKQLRRSTPHTCWGWVKGHREVDGGIVREIRGQVVDPREEPVFEALIEVFAYTNPDLDKRTRVGYQFVGLNGKYELRGSYCKGPGFDAGHTIVTLRPKSKRGSTKPTLVTLNISQ
jgi:hypothetical protein